MIENTGLTEEETRQFILADQRRLDDQYQRIIKSINQKELLQCQNQKKK